MLGKEVLMEDVLFISDTKIFRDDLLEFVDDKFFVDIEVWNKHNELFFFIEALFHENLLDLCVIHCTELSNIHFFFNNGLFVLRKNILFILIFSAKRLLIDDS